MSDVAIYKPRLPMPTNASIPPEQWRVLTDAIFPSAKTSEAIVLALDYCKARKLDPFKRAVHIVPMWNKALRREVETVWPGINELQVTAARTGQWAGMDAPEWGPVTRRTFTREDDHGNVTRAVVEFPEWCSVTVYRMLAGQKCAFCEPVYWTEAYSRVGKSDMPNDMWQKRVRGQLHKNAKAAALRAAFPEEMGNDYTADEMHGQEIDSGGVVLEHVAEAAPRPAPSRPRDVVDADTIPALDEAPPPRVWGQDGTDKLLARLAACETEDALHAIAGDVRLGEWRTKLKANSPDLEARVSAAFSERLTALISETLAEPTEAAA